MNFEDIYGDTPLKVKQRIAHINGYAITYYYDADNPKDRCVIDDFDNETTISFTCSLKEMALDVIDKLNKDKTKTVPYGFRYQHPDILKDIHSNIAFHTTSTKYVSMIEREGLIPGKYATCDVLYASLYLDQHKPKYIPYWMNRTLSVYAEPSYSNLFLSPRKSDYEGKSLFAVDLEGIEWGITSQTVGGFCLYYEEEPNEESYKKWISSDMLKKHCKTYWRLYMSKEEYLAGGARVKRKDSYYGLDEILIPRHLTADRITHIGSWENNHFVPTTGIRAFVKEEYKHDWRDILWKY